jgi:hypothetical protein
MQKDKFIGVFDDVLSNEDQKKIYDHLNTCSWRIFKTQLNNVDFHFTSVFYNNLMGIPEEYDIFAQNHKPIHVLYEKFVETIQPHIGKYEATSIYANCKPYGLNSYLHIDGGDYTFIYYANLEWDAQWEGGTSIYEKDEEGHLDCVRYISYKPNRLIVLPSHMLHRGMPVDRNAFGPRFIVVARGVVNEE